MSNARRAMSRCSRGAPSPRTEFGHARPISVATLSFFRRRLLAIGGLPEGAASAAFLSFGGTRMKSVFHAALLAGAVGAAAFMAPSGASAAGISIGFDVGNVAFAYSDG